MRKIHLQSNLKIKPDHYIVFQPTRHVRDRQGGRRGAAFVIFQAFKVKRIMKKIDIAIVFVEQMVKYWREHKEVAESKSAKAAALTASCYEDAHLSMRRDLEQIRDGEITEKDLR